MVRVSLGRGLSIASGDRHHPRTRGSEFGCRSSHPALADEALEWCDNCQGAIDQERKGRRPRHTPTGMTGNDRRDQRRDDEDPAEDSDPAEASGPYHRRTRSGYRQPHRTDDEGEDKPPDRSPPPDPDGADQSRHQDDHVECARLPPTPGEADDRSSRVVLALAHAQPSKPAGHNRDDAANRQGD